MITHHDLVQASDAFGLTTREELRATGISARSVQRLVRNGQLERITHQLFRLGAVRPTRLQEIATACRSLKGATASHGTAAELHRFRYLPFDNQIHVIIPRGGTRISNLAVVHQRELCSNLREVRPDGIPVTSAAATLMELAGSLSSTRFDRVAEDALDRRLTTLDEVDALIELTQSRGRRGIDPLRAWFERRSCQPVTESELERAFLRFCTRFDIEVPETQVLLHDDAVVVGRIDALFRRKRVAVELDGRAGHQQISDFERDRLRDQRLVAAGWIPLRITWQQIHQRPEELADRIMAIIRRTA